MIKILTASSMISVFFILMPAYAIQTNNCGVDKLSVPKILADIEAIPSTSTQQNDQDYIYSLDNTPFYGMSVNAMKPKEDENCIHTYLRLRDKEGKDIELLISYPNSKIRQEKLVDYVDIGEWKIIGNYSKLSATKGSALVFTPLDDNKKRFVLQTLSEN